METTVKERLIQYLKYKRIGQTKFEALAGLSRGYINNIRKEPTTTKLLMILAAAPDLNKEWLMTGEGDMLNTIDAIPLKPATLEDFTTTKAGSKFYKRSGDGQLLMEVNVVPIAALGSPEDEFATIDERGEWEKTLFEIGSTPWPLLRIRC